MLLPLASFLYALSILSIDLFSDLFFTLLPLAMSCFTLSVAMAPLRKERALLLYVQYFMLGFASEFLSIIGDLRSGFTVGVRNDAIRIFLVWIPFGVIFFKTRSYLAVLPRRSLSDFLLHTVLLQGMAELIPIVFLTLSSLRCVLRYSTATELCRKNSLVS